MAVEILEGDHRHEPRCCTPGLEYHSFVRNSHRQFRVPCFDKA